MSTFGTHTIGSLWLPSVSATTIAFLSDFVQHVPSQAATCRAYCPPCVTWSVAEPLWLAELPVSAASSTTSSLST